MSNVRTVNEQSFNNEVRDHAGLVLVDFYADWCGPCQAQSPILESFAGQRAGDLSVVKVNVDEAPEIARAYGVRSIPTLTLFADGEVVDTRVGTSSEAQLNSLVEQHLAEIKH